MLKRENDDFLGGNKKGHFTMQVFRKIYKKPQWFIAADEVKKTGGSQCGNY